MPMVFFCFFDRIRDPGNAGLEQLGSSRKSEMEQPGAKVTSRGEVATSLECCCGDLIRYLLRRDIEGESNVSSK